MLEALSASATASALKQPVRELTPEQLNVVLYGDGESRSRVKLRRPPTASHHSWDTKFEGVVSNLTRRYKETESDYMREEFERYMAERALPHVQGRPPQARDRAPSRSATRTSPSRLL